MIGTVTLCVLMGLPSAINIGSKSGEATGYYLFGGIALIAIVGLLWLLSRSYRGGRNVLTRQHSFKHCPDCETRLRPDEFVCKQCGYKYLV